MGAPLRGSNQSRAPGSTDGLAEILEKQQQMQRIRGAFLEQRQLQIEGARSLTLAVDQQGAYSDQIGGGMDPAECVHQQRLTKPCALGGAVDPE